VDLGEVVLMPGLVNAHCHLDYTHMAGQFPPPEAFTDWLKLITSTKAGWSFSDYAASWLSGAEMLVRTGTTTVGDIEAVPQLLPDIWESTPLRVCSFLELIGITNRRPPHTVVKEALDKIASCGSRRSRPGLSPHAPYSTVPELLRLSAHTARRRRWRLCIHLAESAAEFAMFARGRGEMFEWFQHSGRDMSDCGLGSPVQHLDRYGLLDENLLAVHVNYLGRKDAALLAERRVHVAHCPRSHSYFRHDAFPLSRLARAGVNICLGTDSLATVYKTRYQVVELNMVDEMRLLADATPSLSPERILRMATLNGARALGMQGQIGELSAGAFADLIALPLAGKVSNIYDSVLQHKGDVTASMIAGRWVIAPASTQSARPTSRRHE
jgi:cytosine/adenosine deaminase-related metal-dependent hydrolase